MEIYRACSGATLVDTEVNIANLSYTYNNQTFGCESLYTETTTFQIYADRILDTNLVVKWEYRYNETCSDPMVCPDYYYDYTNNYVTILAGTSGTTFNQMTYRKYTYCSSEWESWFNDGHDVSAQDQYPACSGYVPPIDCDLSITGYTATGPTTRGGDDGSIVVGITGYTGSTITWKIGGVVDVTQTDPVATFENLTAGNYSIIVYEDLESGCWSQETIVVPGGEFRTGDFQVISPSTVVKAVENPIILELKTAVNSVFPTYSVNTFSITGDISDVVITFNLVFPYIYRAEFRSKGYPDRASYFLESILRDSIGTIQGSNSHEEISTSLAEAIQKDAIISRLYYVSSSGVTVTLQAKEYGDAYDLSSANVTIDGSNVTLANTTPGTAAYDGQISANYSLYTELFVDDDINYGQTPDASTYKRILELELPFSNDNVHKFDLSQSLKNFVESPIYDLEFTGTTYIGGYIGSYYCKYGEKYPLIENSNTKKKRYKGQTTYGYFCNAALNFEDPNDMSDYFIYTGGTINFLNTAPDTKYSHRDGTEVLYFILPRNYAYPVEVRGNIYMWSGNETLDVGFFTITTGLTNTGGLVAINVGYESLGLSAYEVGGELIRKVDIQLWQDTGVLETYSEVKSFLFELDEQPDTFNVAFLSKLGTYETYSFYGELQEAQEVERSLYQKPYNVNTDGSAYLGFQYNTIFNTEYTKIFVANTGVIDEDNFNYLLGLLQSNRIYHYDDQHRNYLVIRSHTATKSTNTNEFSIQIVFSETIKENNVTQ